MNFEELKEYDSTLELIFPDTFLGDIFSLSGVDNLKPNSIAFVKNATFLERFEKSAPNDKSVGIIVERKFWEDNCESPLWKDLSGKIGFIATTKNINFSITYLSKPFYDLKYKDINNFVDGRQLSETEIDSSAWIAQGVFIGEKVKIGANVKIYPGCVIMPEVEIGDDTVLYPNVSIYSFVKIGKNCRIHSGTTIGSDGFGYNFIAGVHEKIWHMGGVEIKNNVEIGANSAVDGGTFEPTIISDGTKIDNHVQIGHNCKVGKGVIFCGNSGLSGSCTVGDYTIFGGKSGMSNDIKIGARSQVAGAAMVNCDWPDESVLGGHPARPLKEWMKGVAFLRKESLKGKN